MGAVSEREQERRVKDEAKWLHLSALIKPSSFHVTVDVKGVTREWHFEYTGSDFMQLLS